MSNRQELQLFGSFWAVAVFDSSVSSLFVFGCDFLETGSSPVAPSGTVHINSIYIIANSFQENV
jgi:hypothetical protein